MNPGHRRGPLASAVAGILLLLTVAGCGAGNNGTPDDSSPTSASASSPVSPGMSAAPTPATATPPPVAAVASPPAQQLSPVMNASAPVTLTIASIGVRTDLLHLGLRENGSLEVPEDTGDGAPASWYNGSPTPGERGPSVMLGHVNAFGGNTGVFADLRKLKNGDEINVSRTDGSIAVFIVDRGALYSKNEFPTLEVYGNTKFAELRLVTCDGYDPATGLFDDNYVIYAKLKT
ncbi:sortase domain-bontaining protein [Arthrobacter glacialis]|uniref:Class F sortase n=1 Tax=Arthrobacter glacialis TaxID=1664 RepID=A0A2S3ZV91_ARTGL|nr:sortase [Arthrobacter glacialis]POH56792.1 class F sortase [Arthrobacter glacialis]POH73175.1 class F sortase [Arthrobacter glacialis]